jgi:DNA-binding NarL/FixJ family response regulator
MTIAQQPIRVLVVDDARGIRAVVRLALKPHADITIVAEAETGLEAVALALEHQPDVVVMDYEMPGLNGVQATAKIIATLPNTKIVIFSASPPQEVQTAGFAAGAMGFVDKEASHDLAAAIRAVFMGQHFVSAP